MNFQDIPVEFISGGIVAIIGLLADQLISRTNLLPDKLERKHVWWVTATIIILSILVYVLRDGGPVASPASFTETFEQGISDSWQVSGDYEILDDALDAENFEMITVRSDYEDFTIIPMLTAGASEIWLQVKVNGRNHVKFYCVTNDGDFGGPNCVIIPIKNGDEVWDKSVQFAVADLDNLSFKVDGNRYSIFKGDDELDTIITADFPAGNIALKTVHGQITGDGADGGLVSLEIVVN